VSVGHVFPFWVPRRYWQLGTRRMIDHVGRMRCIGLWWMLDHESKRMQHGCRGADRPCAVAEKKESC